MKKRYSVWLNELGIEDFKKYEMFKYFGSCEKVYHALEKDYRAIGLTSTECLKIESSKKQICEIDAIIEHTRSSSGHIISIEDDQYPESLREIPNPPIVLYLEGDVACLNRPAIAIVGARKCSEEGYWTAKKIAYDLAKAGFLVLSGLAVGIDQAAHVGALEAGCTVGVLGHGLDYLYPAKHRRLAADLKKKGALITEFSPHTPPLPYRFPKRNRIISGISVGTLVVEAARKSGSLITAYLALEQNKDVFAIPGSIHHSLSEGCNKLIQKGCKLVTCVEDITEEYGPWILEKVGQKSINQSFQNDNGLDKVEIIVYDCLSWQPQSAESLSISCGLQQEVIQSTLLKLELKGFVQRLPANRYMRKNVETRR